MLLTMFYWLCGYLVLEVRGTFPERFVNLCSSSGLYLWGAVRTKEGLLIKTSPRAFRKMRKAAHRSGCRVRILRKVGRPFVLRRYRKRTALFVGLALFALLIGFLNSFIWTIRIDGNELLSDEEIKFITESCGLKQGVIKYTVDKRKFEEKALRIEPRLAWIWPEIRGTVAYIHVREKTLLPSPLDVKRPARVIARRSGRINKLTVKRGWAAVSPGDTVASGEELIRATDGTLSPVHAQGEVLASFWEERSAFASETVTYAKKTGRAKSYYSFRVGSFGMSLRFSQKPPFDTYMVTKEEHPMLILGDVPLPIMKGRTLYEETDESTLQRSMEQAEAEVAEQLKKQFEEALEDGVTIQNVEVRAEDTQEGRRVTVVFECEADIALTDFLENGG